MCKFVFGNLSEGLVTPKHDRRIGVITYKDIRKASINDIGIWRKGIQSAWFKDKIPVIR